jgi:hypothetical protein
MDYRKPELTALGSLAALTLGSGGSTCDAAGQNSNQLGGGNDDIGNGCPSLGR